MSWSAARLPTPPIGLALFTIAIFVVLQALARALPATDPLALFGAALEFGSNDRRTLDAGGALVKVLPGRQRDVSLIGIVRTDASGERLMAWMRRVEELYRGRYVPVVARFSDPPQIEDLAALELDDRDLESLRDCKVADCEVKLSAPEMAVIKTAIAGSGPAWKAAAQNAVRQVVLARAEGFLQRGLTGMTYDDEDRTVSLASEFFSVAAAPDGLGTRFPELTDDIRRFAGRTDGVNEGFLYWSRQEYGAKPVISLTYVNVVPRPAPRVAALAVAQQVFATHYLTASLSFTAIVNDANGAPAYLLYENRSRVDFLDGPLASIRRLMVERRLRSEGPRALDRLRKKLESDPDGLSIVD